MGHGSVEVTGYQVKQACSTSVSRCVESFLGRIRSEQNRCAWWFLGNQAGIKGQVGKREREREIKSDRERRGMSDGMWGQERESRWAVGAKSNKKQRARTEWNQSVQRTEMRRRTVGQLQTRQRATDCFGRAHLTRHSHRTHPTLARGCLTCIAIGPQITESGGHSATWSPFWPSLLITAHHCATSSLSLLQPTGVIVPLL